MDSKYFAQVQIAYEDDELLVLVKPAGMLVHPTVKLERDTLYDFVQEYYQGAGLNWGVHPVFRLDRFTSGLVLFAKEPHLQGVLSRMDMVKEYLALVVGNLPASHGIIDTPIARKPGSIVERQVDPLGKPARTEYWVLEHFKNLTLVRLRLYTGRTHQIRVHMASTDCPLYGDHLYGESGPQGRHALHAYKLEFEHPVTGKLLTLTWNLPDDLQKVIYPI